MANQNDPVVAKYMEQMIDDETGEPVAENSGVQVEFFMEAALDYTLTEGGNILKSHPKVKEIRKMEQDNLRLLKEQEPFAEDEPKQPKEQDPAIQRAWKEAHAEWDKQRETWYADLAERAKILDEDPDHKDVLIVRPAGRPIYVDREYIEIRTPGDRDNVPRRPVRNSDIAQHRAQYERWKKGQAQIAKGTPLTQLAGITKSMEKELAHYNIQTVEQLAATSDGNLARVGPIMALRQRARDWVATMKGMAPIDEARSEARKARDEVQQLKARLAELERAQKAKQT